MFGIDVFDAGLLVSLTLALLAGVISFASPCVLPIVPPYLAYMGGISMGDMTGQVRRRPVILASIFFVLGLSTVFAILGFAFSFLGQLVAQYQVWLNTFAGGVLIVFGLHFMHVITIPFLYREARIDVGDTGGSAFGAYLLGLAFAFGWSPCLGPMLTAILSLVAQDAELGKGVAMLGAYAAGLGVPFILAAIFINRAMGVMNRLKRHMRKVEIAMGALLILVGIAIMTNRFSVAAFWLLETFPILAEIG